MKKILTLGAAALITAFSSSAQNRVNLTLNNGTVDTYETENVDNISINDSRVTVNVKGGTPTVYDGKVSGISFLKSAAGNVVLTEAGGWFETTYVKWENMAGATNYEVYVKAVSDNDWKRLDYQLVRNYGTFGRADMPGLKAGQYVMKVVPVIGGAAQEAKASETGVLTVKAHDRAGFAHFNYNQGVGAYNNDGTLKEGAKVFYVTKETAKTISTTVNTGKKEETFTGMQAIINAYQKGADSTPLDFRIIGRLHADDMDDLLSSAIGLQVKGKDYSMMNITIEGIGDDAVLHYFGILIRYCQSVEIRNLALMYFPEDGISLDTHNSHIWIHNVDFFYGKNGGGDKAKGDGSLDLKDDSQYLTLSYNHFWDSGKASLCGMKSETQPNWITYHHNWFDHSDSRHPRIRHMSVHVWNNYYDGVSKYGVGATTGADAFVEANYYRDCKYPILTSLQGSDIMGEGSTPNGKGTFSSEAGGSIKAYGNIMRGRYFYRPWSAENTTEFDCYEVTDRATKVPSDVKAKSGGDTYSNWDTDPSLMYEYTPDAAADVPSVVKGIYGAGRINHGDFRWTFNNATQDKNYDIVATLSTEVQTYRGKLVGFYEGSTSFGDNGAGFTNSGGDAEEGVEFPFGDGNAAMGGGGNQGGNEDPVAPGAVFMGNEDGTDYLWFNEANSEKVNAWIADGTITLSEGSSFLPTFCHDTYNQYTGSIQLAKNGGTAVFKCPSISTLKVQLMRSGSYKGSIEISKDGGATWTAIHNFNEKKGNITLDLSAAAASAGEALIRFNNTSTGGLNIHGILILKAAE